VLRQHAPRPPVPRIASIPPTFIQMSQKEVVMACWESHAGH
jgi:hypothetical protein